MEWFWIFAFTMAAVGLIVCLVWSILWRKRENKALLEAIVIQIQEEDLAASRRASRRWSEISEATTREVAGPSNTSTASSCQSLPSTSSEDRLYQANNNEMQMKVLATPTAVENNTVDRDRATPTDSDWREGSRLSASNTVDTDFTPSVSSRPQSASSGTSSKGDSEELENNRCSTPTVTFSGVPKRGDWKVNRKSSPLATEDESAVAKYGRIQSEKRVAGTVPFKDGTNEKDRIMVPVQSSDESDDDSNSTKL